MLISNGFEIRTKINVKFKTIFSSKFDERTLLDGSENISIAEQKTKKEFYRRKKKLLTHT